ncbi:MAG: galactokinase [Deltaproteobacteria bacterium]|nr:galactokinase [Deltaproteobacteria bacterium]
MVLVQDILSKQPVTASAPCRIDSGGTWDIKALALPFEAIGPTTVNIALTLRTTVSLYPYEAGQVKIRSIGFARPEVFSAKRLPFDTPFGLFFAAASFFGFHGLDVQIDSQSPVKSALGGSSTALVALIKALSKVASGLGRKSLSKKEILHLGYHLEDAVSGGNCGIQDQAAAVYGGVRQWEWCFGNQTSPFKNRVLLDREGARSLSRCLLVAYSGKSHTALRTNRQWIKDFLSGKTRSGWLKVNETVHQFGQAVAKRNWNRAAALIREEMSIRREITPEALTPTTNELIEAAENTGCGARFTGAGAGGSLWAMGDKKRIGALRGVWETRMARINGAAILDCEVDPAGVK